MAALQARHPGFREAVAADASITAKLRGERDEFRSAADLATQVIRLCWTSDAFLAQVLYRLKASLQAKRVPLLPRLAHKAAMSTGQVSIGDPVVIEPGMYLLHGQVVIDGLVEIGAGAVIAPWVTIGLRAGNVEGAQLGRDVKVGTGAKIIGPVRIGHHATIGANSVVVDDVPEGATAVGAPARRLEPSDHQLSVPSPPEIEEAR